MDTIPLSLLSQTGQVGRTISKGDSDISDSKDKALVRACQEMESLFLCYLLKEMRASIPKSELGGNETARDLYTSMSDQCLANELAGKGGIGLAQVLLDRLNVQSKF